VGDNKYQDICSLSKLILSSFIMIVKRVVASRYGQAPREIENN
jgi:hypothetical protein